MVTSLSLCGTGQLAENQRFARLGSRGSVFSGGKNKEADFNCMTLNKLTINLFAERGGFEPPIPFWSIHAFQACLLSHSSISPM